MLELPIGENCSSCMEWIELRRDVIAHCEQNTQCLLVGLEVQVLNVMCWFCRLGHHLHDFASPRVHAIAFSTRDVNLTNVSSAGKILDLSSCSWSWCVVCLLGCVERCASQTSQRTSHSLRKFGIRQKLYWRCLTNKIFPHWCTTCLLPLHRSRSEHTSRTSTIMRMTCRPSRSNDSNEFLYNFLDVSLDDLVHSRDAWRHTAQEGLWSGLLHQLFWGVWPEDVRSLLLSYLLLSVFSFVSLSCILLSGSTSLSHCAVG